MKNLFPKFARALELNLFPKFAKTFFKVCYNYKFAFSNGSSCPALRRGHHSALYPFQLLRRDHAAAAATCVRLLRGGGAGQAEPTSFESRPVSQTL
jgi:hypothetical protein